MVITLEFFLVYIPRSHSNGKKGCLVLQRNVLTNVPPTSLWCLNCLLSPTRFAVKRNGSSDVRLRDSVGDSGGGGDAGAGGK